MLLSIHFFACLSVTLVPASARGGPRVAVWARVSLRVRSEALSATFIARVNDYWGRPRDSDAATVHARWVYRRCSFLHRVRITLRSIKIFWQWSTRTRITLNWTINSVIALHCVSSAHATTVVWSYEYLFNYTIRVIFFDYDVFLMSDLTCDLYHWLLAITIYGYDYYSCWFSWKSLLLMSECIAAADEQHSSRI